MLELDLLNFLIDLDCKATTRDECIQFLVDEGKLTFSGTAFENEIILKFLHNLDWNMLINLVIRNKELDNDIED